MNEANAQIEMNQKISDKSLSKRALHIQKKEDAMKKIRDLGLPAGSQETVSKDTTSSQASLERYIYCHFIFINNVILYLTQLLKRLHEVNDGLKKYSHVNKKAYEQYSNFTKQRDLLQQRKQDLDKSAAVNH